MIDRELQQKRIVAAVIDMALAIGLWIAIWVGERLIAYVLFRAISSSTVAGWVSGILGVLGWLVLLGYILGRDVVAGGTSVGKKTQGLRVVTAAGAPITAMESARRNGVFALGPALAVVASLISLIPCLGAFINCVLALPYALTFLASGAAVLYELYRIAQDPSGIRFGDQMAGTRVVR